MDLFKLVGRIVISNEEANTSIDETTTKAQGLSDTLGGVSQGADNTGKTMGASGKLGSATVWMGNMFTKLTEKGMALGKFIGKTGFGFDAAMEAYQNQFEALIGDADKASKLVADLQLLAKVSPLGMEGLANNAVSLLNTGTELADIIPTLEMLGNLALGDTNKMNSIVRAYTQILSKGQLMAQEMYQMGDAGVPIREIMTLYGGERYADGEWYQLKMSKPDYKIMSEDMVTAFRAATAEGGKWHDYMFKMMDTWNGQTDRMGEEGKETLGAFMMPFFEMAKSNVLPALTESLGKFGTWVSENQGTLEKMAEAVGQLVTGGFDMIIDVGTWLMENGEAVKVAILGIATALTIGAIAAHPYATAIMAVVAGLAMLKASDTAKGKDSHLLENFSAEELSVLQRYVDAMNELTAAENAYNEGDGAFDDALVDRVNNARDAADAATKEAKSIDGLLEKYKEWASRQDGNLQDGIYLDVPLKVADGSEASMQTEIDGYDMEGVVKMLADTSGLQSAINATGLSAYVNLIPSTAAGVQVDGSHASGLDRVPRDGYIARLHKDETVLNSTMATAYRNGTLGGGNTGRMEALLGQMMTIMQQVAANTAGGHQVVLDSGVLVGQIAPRMDVQLGAISGRKGRRG